MANITTNNVDKKHLIAGVDIDEMKRQMLELTLMK
jgi:hypothetical protein